MTEIKESEKVEFKKSLAQLDDALKAICAFLNHKGGAVYFGINDKGEIVGTNVSAASLKEVSQKVRQQIKPEVTVSVKEIKAKGKSIIKVGVPKGTNKPYFYKGVAYRRAGVESVPIPPDELKRTILEQRERQFDKEICEEARISDIDPEAVKNFKKKYEEINKKKLVGGMKEILQTLGCLKGGKPTNAGILLFGKNPQQFFSRAYIALVRYRGSEITEEQLDRVDFEGNILDQIDKAEEYLLDHTATMSRLLEGRVQRQNLPEYPKFSLRELIINAIAHRDYSVSGSKIIISMFSDRIEYYSPGRLPKGITPKNITREQHSRNKTIVKVLNKVDYIEELGQGWNRIIKEAKTHPLKPKLPQIEDTDNSVIATLYAAKFPEKTDVVDRNVSLNVELMNERQKKALGYTKEKGRITSREYTELNETSKRTAIRELNEMVRKKLLLMIGKGKAIHYVPS